MVSTRTMTGGLSSARNAWIAFRCTRTRANQQVAAGARWRDLQEQIHPGVFTRIATRLFPVNHGHLGGYHIFRKTHMAFGFWIVMCIYYIRNYIYSNITYVAVATIVIKYIWGLYNHPRSDPPNDKWLRFTLWGWLAGSSWLEEHPPSILGLFKMENSPPWPLSIIKYL